MTGEMRWCRAHKCDEPVENFYRDSTMKDGLMDICKEEMRRRQEVRRVDGRMAKSMAKYGRSKKGRLRGLARAAVKKAIHDGVIVKPPHCQFGDALKYNGLYIRPGVKVVPCTETKLEFHHYKGYAERHWLTGIFLCPKHHADCETEERS